MHNPKKPSNLISESGELRLAGTAVSRGVAIGRSVRLFGKNRQFIKKTIEPADIKAELERLNTAVATSKYQILKLLRSKNELPASAPEIFEVHLLMIEQSRFVKDVAAAIEGQNVNAEWAVKTVTEEYVERQNSAPDADLREKSVEIEDVAERIVSALGDASDLPLEILDGSVIFASTIRPSTLIELSRHSPLAIVTEHGGWTSHAFIMAREMRIPAVTGIRNLLESVDDGAETVVDGYRGQVIVRPTKATLNSIPAAGEPAFEPAIRSLAEPVAPRTLDGREIIIRANAESEQSVEGLPASGAIGVGLLRSEYLVANWSGATSSEAEQAATYRKIIDAAAPYVVRIRTFDLNADQFNKLPAYRENNPSLGLRAIRLSFANESAFRSQIRAILRSGSGRDVGILLPMVSGVDEIVRAKTLIHEEKESLLKDGVVSGDGGVGAMIEVPSAVLMIDDILQNVDFICLGTNDLVQYLLAVDRDNESVAEFYQTLHPAVTRSIRAVITAAERANVPAAMCGEMAGSPFYAPLLVGYGAREFSMNVDSIPQIRKVIEGISYDEARTLAREVDASANAKDAENLIRLCYNQRWPHLFPENFLDLAAEKSLHNSLKN